MAGETCAFLNAFDAAFILHADFAELLCIDLPIIIYTDSKLLFDAVTKGKRTTEKRLMIDISTA